MNRPTVPLCAAVLLLFVAFAAAPALADEGMWLLNNFPSKAVGAKYGFAPDQAWLDQTRLSAVRLAGGCSGSFVSPHGLVMTNYHCIVSCVQDLTTPERPVFSKGFMAKTAADEVQCPGFEINQLIEITDVTQKVLDATRGKSGAAFADAQRATISTITKACATGPDVRCDVVNLYHGGQYELYKYRRFQDVRLVFAPEYDTGFFGGDPDNFNFPRWNLDASFLRVYQDGKPLATPHHFRFSKAGAREGDLVFVAGHPGSTSRLNTVAELVYERDSSYPQMMMRMSEMRGMLREFEKRGPEYKRYGESTRFFVENSIKSSKGQWDTLLDPAFMARKTADETAVREAVTANPELAAKYGDAWDRIAEAQAIKRRIGPRYAALEGGRRAFGSSLFGYARRLVRAAEELPLPNEKRLKEYSDAALPGLKQQLAARSPIFKPLEIEMMALSLTFLREQFGTDDPMVKSILGTKSPEELATELVNGTTLEDPAVRIKLLEGGRAAIDASTDPMIRFARKVDPESRAIRRQYEAEVEAVEDQYGEEVAQAWFAVRGKDSYPDATFTLRLTYGTVAGWEQDGRTIAPFTTLGGMFERATGADPYDLPPSWLAAKERLDLKTPFNLVATTDIIGGNSGSPMIDQDRQVVGLVFDGNIHSLGGEYWFDLSKNRTIAVHSAAMLEALGKVYGGQRIVDELTAAK